MEEADILELMEYARAQVASKQGMLDRIDLIRAVRARYKASYASKIKSNKIIRAIDEAEKRGAIVLQDPHIGHDIQTAESGKKYFLGTGRIEELDADLHSLGEQAGFQHNRENLDKSLVRHIYGADDFYLNIDTTTGVVYVFTFSSPRDNLSARYFRRDYRRLASEGLNIATAQPHFTGKAAIRTMRAHAKERRK